MKRILINGSPADLSSAPIAVNWEYLNLSDPGKKYSPYTSSLTLPFTPKNKSIMGFADVVGGDMAKVRDVRDVDLWLGPLKFIKGGTLKVLSSTKDGYQGTITGRNRYIEAIEGYTLDEIITDCAATFTYADYADAIESLRAGSDAGINPGFILPRTLEGSIASSIWTIYSVANGHTHEVWLSAAAIITQMIAENVLTLKVWEGDALIDVTASTLWADLEKLYMPCWNWVLYDGAAWTLELASGQRLINGEVVDRSQLVTFGGKSSWDFIKAIAQLFCAAVYQDETEITLIPLNQITTTGAIDLSGRVKPEKKYFAIPGLGSANYVSYENTDNLNEDFARLTITAPVVPTGEKALMTLDLMLPGQYYVNQYYKNFFNTDYNANGSLKDKPLLLYDGGDTDYTTITHGTDTEVDVLLKVLTYMDLAQWWLTYQSLATLGEAYDAEIYIDAYTLTKLRPWLLVRINELGGLFYLSKITGFDPDSGRLAKCQVVKWCVGKYDVTPTSLVFTYNGETKTLTVTSNIPWLVTTLGDVTLNKASGTGNDTVIVTCDSNVEADTEVNFNFGGAMVDVVATMQNMTLNSVAAVGTQGVGDPISPNPTFSATAIGTGPRRVFWAIYKALALVSSGYRNFTITAGTNNYAITGLTAPGTAGTDYTLRVGYKSGTYPVSSAQFTVII